MKVALTTIAAVALFALVPPVAQAAPRQSPSPQQICESRGYMWDSQRGCASRTCSSGGRTYQPGDTRSVRTIKGNWAFFYCDGFTGQWERV